jgi:hypothetical protein
MSPLLLKLTLNNLCSSDGFEPGEDVLALSLGEARKSLLEEAKKLEARVQQQHAFA